MGSLERNRCLVRYFSACCRISVGELRVTKPASLCCLGLPEHNYLLGEAVVLVTRANFFNWVPSLCQRSLRQAFRKSQMIVSLSHLQIHQSPE